VAWNLATVSLRPWKNFATAAVADTTTAKGAILCLLGGAFKAITLYEMYIFIALLIYIGIVGTSNIVSYWDKSGNTFHKPIESMTLYQFQQIKRYFHISPPPITSKLSHLPTTRWYTKLEPLASLFRTKF
jgi:hypothetical protein